MKRIPVALMLAAAAPATAQVAPPAVVATVPEPTAEEVLLEFATVAGRMTVPVTLGDKGPWRFIVDTGAERTVVSRELAETLGLAAGPRARVVAMAGPAPVATVVVPVLTVTDPKAKGGPAIGARGIVSPALGARDMGALGMVGIDALQDHSVVIDFARERMTVARSGKRRRAPVSRDDVVVRARSLYGQLIVTDARWRGRRIAVVIDTGTPISVGNPALGRLMADARPAGTVGLISVTGGVLAAEMVTTGGIEVAGIGFSRVSLAIADAAPFHRFDLVDTPALMMGMDLLRLFRGVRIDFANREIRFTLPERTGIRINE